MRTTASSSFTWAPVTCSGRSATRSRCRCGATPEVDSELCNKYILTNAFKATQEDLFDGEVATVWNSFHAESEFIAARVEGGDDPCFKGFYAQAGYFLTGEVRPYNRNAGTFNRIRPLKNFREGDGLGAWEVAARYSYLGLDQHDIGGKDREELDDVTIGLNWYLNPAIRIMWDYIHAMPSCVTSDTPANIFMMRFQIDF